jgi:hypothetical protein
LEPEKLLSAGGANGLIPLWREFCAVGINSVCLVFGSWLGVFDPNTSHTELMPTP